MSIRKLSRRLKDIELHLENCPAMSVLDAYYDQLNKFNKKLKKIKRIKMSSVMSKISKHKWKLWIIVAETLLWMAGAYGRYLFLKFGDTPEADLIFEMTGIVNIGLAMLSAYIFGNKTELDDKVGENQMLKTMNWEQHYIITANKLDDPGFYNPNVKKEI